LSEQGIVRLLAGRDTYKAVTVPRTTQMPLRRLA